MRSTPGAVGGFAWHDLDCDGLQGAAEPGLAGVPVTLETPFGQTLLFITGADGRFAFTNLQPGAYRLSFDAARLPTGFSPTACGVGNNASMDSDCVPVLIDLGVEEQLSFDIGFVNDTCIELGVIGGLAWHDLDCNGIQNGAEPGIEGVRVTLTTPGGLEREDWTNADGRFGFLDLIPGTYILCYDEASVPLGFSATDCGVGDNRHIDSDCCPAVVNLDLAEGVSVDFGFRGPCCTEPGVIGGFAWHDVDCDGLQNNGEPGLAGVRVLLGDEQGGLREAFSAPDGRFEFGPLCAGLYSLSFDPDSLPVGFTPTDCEVGEDENDDSDCSPVEVFLAAGEGESIDFGFRGICCDGQGRIGSRVWHDVDCNGLQDAGEPGLAGVRVVLTDDKGGEFTALTDEHGRYEFTGLCPATYSVCVDLESVPSSFEPTDCELGDDAARDSNCCPAVVHLELPAGNDSTIDFGFRSTCCAEPGQILTRIWQDLDCDGRQEPNEPGIPGVRVVATNTQDEEFEAYSNAAGDVVLLGLCGDVYRVCFDPLTVPLGLTPTTCGSGQNRNLDSDCCPALVELGPGAFTERSVDFGFVTGCCDGPGRIGDLVWHDLDGDGLQTPGEPGIAGVRVVLEGGPSGMLETFTDADGRYRFVGVCFGEYTVVVDEASLPPGLAPTACEQGAQPLLDSNCPETSIVLQPDDAVDLSVDFGFVTLLGSTPPRVDQDRSPTEEPDR